MTQPNDPRWLERQYRSADNLRARQALHERFGRGGASWSEWLFEAFPRGAELVVLELGCGPGRLWRELAGRLPPGWRLTLSDLSAGMVSEARRVLDAAGVGAEVVQADARALPFASEAFDLVIANHMLYHVPDIPAALAEVRRVLRPGGTFMAATNGRRHLLELDRMARETLGVELFGVGGAPRSSSFSLENGAPLLAEVFARVERKRYRNDLWVTEAAAITAYLRSVDLTAGGLGEEEVAARLGRLEEELERRIAGDGGIRIGRDSGIFLAHGRRPPPFPTGGLSR